MRRCWKIQILDVRRVCNREEVEEKNEGGACDDPVIV